MMDPEKLLSSSDLLVKIETVCKRRFSAENDQNECYLYVIDSLKADNFKRLWAFKGNSKINTYLYSLINSLVIDFRRKLYGRRRIPAGVAKLGKWAETVYRLVCWQKFTFDDAYDFLRIDGLYSGSYSEFIQEVEPIKKAPCRENPAFQSLDEAGKSVLKNINDQGANPLEFLIRKLDRERRVKAIKVIRLTTAALPEEDQLLVRLVYGSDRSVSAAAKVIGLPVSTAGKRLKRLLTKYREKLLAEGIREP
jgi:RNA polymerase sigma factor (sigma-70 family)